MDLKVSMKALREDLQKEMRQRSMKKIMQDSSMYSFLNSQNEEAIKDINKKDISDKRLLSIILELESANKCIENILNNSKSKTANISIILSNYKKLNNHFAKAFAQIESKNTYPQSFFISFYLQGHRLVLTDEVINEEMFGLSLGKNGQFSLALRTGLQNYQDILEQQQIDKQINQHYRQFSNYTNKYYIEESSRKKLVPQGGFFGVAEQIDSSFKENKKDLGKAWLKYKKEESFMQVVSDMTFYNDNDKKNYLSDIVDYYGKSLNQGHIAEAFERHLEKHHKFIENGYPKEKENISFDAYPDESVEEWITHLVESRGQWPGYFGPDTEYSQVKSAMLGSGNLIITSSKKLIDAQIYIRQFLKIINTEEKQSIQNTLQEYLKKIQNNYRVGAKQAEKIQEILQNSK